MILLFQPVKLYARIEKAAFPNGEVYSGSKILFGLPLPFFVIIKEQIPPITGEKEASPAEDPEGYKEAHRTHIGGTGLYFLFFLIDLGLLICIVNCRTIYKLFFKLFSGEFAMKRYDREEAHRRSSLQ